MFINVEKVNYPVKLLCKVLQVGRSSFYAWLKRSEKRSEKERKLLYLTTMIRAEFFEQKLRYGSPRIYRSLKAKGIKVGRNTIAKIMQQEGLRAVSKRSKKNRKSDQVTTQDICENVLNQNFKVERANVAWVSDITYIKTSTKWLYLATIIDLWSRKVVGWAIDNHMRTSLVLNALKMAVSTRKINKGLIHHSDQGSQYTSHEYQEYLRNLCFVSSMNRRGNCLDNAVAESFFSSLKKELIYLESLKNLPDHIVHKKVLNYIHWYNSKRIHSTLNHMSPVDYELKYHTMNCMN